MGNERITLMMIGTYFEKKKKQGKRLLSINFQGQSFEEGGSSLRAEIVIHLTLFNSRLPIRQGKMTL